MVGEIIGWFDMELPHSEKGHNRMWLHESGSPKEWTPKWVLNGIDLGRSLCFWLSQVW